MGPHPTMRLAAGRTPRDFFNLDSRAYGAGMPVSRGPAYRHRSAGGSLPGEEQFRGDAHNPAQGKKEEPPEGCHTVRGVLCSPREGEYGRKDCVTPTEYGPHGPSSTPRAKIFHNFPWARGCPGYSGMTGDR